MRNVEVRIEQSPEGDWWVYCDEAVGFFAYGETREEALENAKDALSMILDIEDNKIKLLVTEN